MSAWAASQDWWWVDEFYIRVCGGRALYQWAAPSRYGRTVNLFRDTPKGYLCRYVPAATPVELIPMESAA